VAAIYGGGSGGGPGEVEGWRKAMGIPWMMRDELAQAIPPVYTEYIGNALMETLTAED
jgi:DNA (cytosine-5)-methyltransferase 1